LRSLVLAVICLLVAAPLPAQDGREALIQSLERERLATYAGLQTTTITGGGRTRRTEQVVKRRPGKLRIEYLAPARLKGGLVVDDGKQFRRYIPSLKVVEEGPSRLQRALKRHRQQVRDLRDGKAAATLVGEETLLGRKVTVVTITPSKPDRPTRTLWLDQASGVPLRVVEKGRGGRTSVTTFERIEFKPVLGSAEFQLPIPAGVTVVPARLGRPISPQQAEQIARRLWGSLPMPGSVPEGYTLTSAHQLHFHKQPVIALRYTRGREALTLFVSGAGGAPYVAPVKPGVNVVQRPMGAVLVTLVGSLPSTELQRITASLR
jgi:outer membrane lipoprotein-sorting protein